MRWIGIVLASLIGLMSIVGEPAAAAPFFILGALSALPQASRWMGARKFGRAVRVGIPVSLVVIGCAVIGALTEPQVAKPAVLAKATDKEARVAPAPTRVAPAATRVAANKPAVESTLVNTTRQDVAATLLEDQPDDVLARIRATTMQVIFCSGEIDTLQAAIDRASRGTGTAMQAYSAGHAAERDCRKMSTEWKDFEERPFKTTPLNDLYSRTLPTCRAVSRIGVRAARVAKVFLDQNASFAKAQEYLDARNEMAAKLMACKAGLKGLADRAQVKAADVEFLGT